MAYVITQPCVDCKDRSCVEVCPTDCIYEGARMLYIHPDECVDCGACEICPVDAVFDEGEVPEQWRAFTTANREFFETLGSPGGANDTGPLDFDHPMVAALPPQAGC